MLVKKTSSLHSFIESRENPHMIQKRLPNIRKEIVVKHLFIEEKM